MTALHVATVEGPGWHRSAANAINSLLRNVATTNAAIAPKLEWVAAPATAADPGTAGQVAYDGSYLYLCTATDTWRRIAHATW